MYRRPKFLEVLLDIRQKMAREADYDVDLFAELIRSGQFAQNDEFALGEPKPEAVKAARPAKERVRRAV